jgi:imidazole glycerol phosphate synthase glutamine amidotransferase subunit
MHNPPHDGVTLVSTGLANVASVRAAFARLGVLVREAQTPAEVLHARAVVLPGVGAFGPAMHALHEQGMGEAIAQRVRAQQPLLAICLGLQVLCEASEESPGVRGLGVVPGVVRRLREDASSQPACRVPHMGWNEVVCDGRSAGIVRSGAMYFANSFAVASIPSGWQGTIATHADPFVASIERGPIVACQFHPELSGECGAQLLARWCERALRSVEASTC